MGSEKCCEIWEAVDHRSDCDVTCVRLDDHDAPCTKGLGEVEWKKKSEERGEWAKGRTGDEGMRCSD